MRSATPVTSKLLKQFVPGRDPNSRKGQNGRVLVIGGSEKYFGSPALVGLAALRAGADLAYILTPRFAAPTIASYSPDLIVWSYEGTQLNSKAFALLGELELKTDTLVIGNGLTKHPEALKYAREIISSWEKPIVIDADAIMPGLKITSKNAVLTPHSMEFERLSGSKPSKDLDARANQIAKLAERIGATILLKGTDQDLISNGKASYSNETGNAGMTAGGTGDTLAGICGALLAQGAKPVEAAAASAFINGAAGDLAFKKLGYSLLATDIISELPSVMKKLARAL